MSKVPEAGIFTVSVALYMGAFAWVFIRGPGSFLAGMLTGGGSIAMGVWIGLVISHHRSTENNDTRAD